MSHSVSPTKKTPIKTPKYHRTVFGNNHSPNLVNQSINSIYTVSNGILSPNFNVVNSDWNNLNRNKHSSSIKKIRSRSNSISKYSENKLQAKSRPNSSSASVSLSSSSINNPLSLSFQRNHRTFGDFLNNEKTKIINNNKTNLIYNDTKSDDQINGSTRKIRRTNTNEFSDRFIPSRQTTSGKLTIEKTKSLPSFAMPSDHIESQTSEIYQNSVAQACGLEVGQRILQFQPLPPENNLLKRNPSFGNSINSKFKTRQSISTSAAQARMKKIPLCPEKVLDAPGLVDDFYLNLISWSKDNNLAIALNNSVYCWNANNGNVDLIAECDSIITSIKWSPDDYYLSIGLDNGNLEIWDIETKTKSRTMNFQNNTRIATQSWNDYILSNGTRNGTILNNDVRISNHIINKYENHTAEVCGLEWRKDGTQLASGGNDNLVNIWDIRNCTKPNFTKTAHNAAVKAIAWCPTQLNLLATGGGSSCKKIHFWNSNTGIRINTIETESQVSSLKWGYSNGIGKEIVSTHGFPNNEISVYSYPSLQKTGVISDAHENRILNSELSPNGTILVTVAADENLKFWKLFDELVLDDDKEYSSSTGGKNLGKVMTIR